MAIELDIISLWTKFQKVNPEGAPDIVVYRRSTVTGSVLPLDDYFSMSQAETEIALWRIMQFVAWYGNQLPHSDLWTKGVNGKTWAEALPVDWITAAGAVLTRIEEKVKENDDG